MTSRGQAAVKQKSDNQLERYIAALLKSIETIEKSRGPRGPKDYSKLHKKKIIDKNGVPRNVWVSNEQKPNSQNEGKSNTENIGQKRKRRKKIKPPAPKPLTPKQAANLEKINSVLNRNAQPMPKKIELSQDSFDKLFKNGIDSPIERIKIGENQLAKLIAKNRQGLLAAMADVMKDPAVIIKTTDNAKIYAKTYKDLAEKGKSVISVIVDKGNIHVSISTHIEENKQIARKMDSILYEKKTESVHGENPPHGVDLPIKDSLPQSNRPVNKKPKKNKKISKSKKWIWVDENGKLWIRKSVLEAWRQGMAEEPNKQKTRLYRGK